MNNFIQIMALDEKKTQSTIFVKAQEEGGINEIYDPESNQSYFQVFIHSTLPYKNSLAKEFQTFSSARSFAANMFQQDWEMLHWDGNLTRPCARGEGSCGGGSCGTNGGGCSTGGCSSCGA